jgi:hypothetical protein
MACPPLGFTILTVARAEHEARHQDGHEGAYQPEERGDGGQRPGIWAMWSSSSLKSFIGPASIDPAARAGRGRDGSCSFGTNGNLAASACDLAPALSAGRHVWLRPSGSVTMTATSRRCAA